MSAHTPTPWKSTANSWQYTTIYDANGDVICRLDLEDWGVTEDNQDRLETVQAEVVSQIIKAVNRDHHFEALVKALEKARTRIEYLGAACQNPKHFEANAETFLPAIDEVLAAAGRGQ